MSRIEDQLQDQYEYDRAVLEQQREMDEIELARVYEEQERRVWMPDALPESDSSVINSIPGSIINFTSNIGVQPTINYTNTPLEYTSSSRWMNLVDDEISPTMEKPKKKKELSLSKKIHDELTILKERFGYSTTKLDASFPEAINSLKGDSSVFRDCPITIDNGFFIIYSTIYFLEEDKPYKQIFNGSYLYHYTDKRWRSAQDLDTVMTEFFMNNSMDFQMSMETLAKEFLDQSIIIKKLADIGDLSSNRTFFMIDEDIAIEATEVESMLESSFFYSIENMFHYRQLMYGTKISPAIKNIGFNLKNGEVSIKDVIDARETYWETAINPSKHIYDFYTSIIEVNNNLCETLNKKREFEKAVYKRMGLLYDETKNDDDIMNRDSPVRIEMRRGILDRVRESRGVRPTIYTSGFTENDINNVIREAFNQGRVLPNS
jgi:hypothetical protein